jgi:nucleotide-binding universal stress UspA family protein
MEFISAQCEDVRPVIVQKAKELRADTVIVGSRGYGQVPELILGSVSDYVMHNAHCSVLIAR